MSSSDHYIVERIDDKQVINGKTWYYLKWLGWPQDDNTWQQEKDLNCPELIAEYERTVLLEANQEKGKKSRKRKKKKDGNAGSEKKKKKVKSSSKKESSVRKSTKEKGKKAHSKSKNSAVLDNQVQVKEEQFDDTSNTYTVLANQFYHMQVKQEPIDDEIPIESIVKDEPSETPVSNSHSNETQVSNSHSSEIPISNSHSNEIPVSNSHLNEIPVSNSHLNEIPVTNSYSNKIPVSNSHSNEELVSMPGASPSTVPNELQSNRSEDNGPVNFEESNKVQQATEEDSESESSDDDDDDNAVLNLPHPYDGTVCVRNPMCDECAASEFMDDDDLDNCNEVYYDEDNKALHPLRVMAVKKDENGVKYFIIWKEKSKKSGCNQASMVKSDDAIRFVPSYIIQYYERMMTLQRKFPGPEELMQDSD